jgi:hypothetical protein
VTIPRRSLLGALAGLPLILPATTLPLASCTPAPKTPLAHLYGPQWVHGAYELYAKGYQNIQEGAEQSSFDAYGALAQKGVTALDALQSRGVPFFIKVGEDQRAFTLERKVPERLTFTADMSDKDRENARVSWERAREFIHKDYEEIRRLNTALTMLLGQQQRIRNAILKGHEEQYQLVRQLGALSTGGPPPFPLPYQVSSADYQDVLHLLIERLDDDARRLANIEASIVTVGLTARSTDAGSGSLAANLTQVLLAIVHDAEGSKPRPSAYPEAERQAVLDRGKKLADGIRATPEYQTWLKHEETKAFEQVGSVLALIDQVTHIPVSGIYMQVLDIWRGEGDYLSYVKTALSIVPGGSQLAKILTKAVETTEKVRDVKRQLGDGVSPDALAEALKKKGVGLLNTGSKYATDRVDKQLAFFSSRKELDQIQGALASTEIAQKALPASLR